jgi:hypothetical protein
MGNDVNGSPHVKAVSSAGEIAARSAGSEADRLGARPIPRRIEERRHCERRTDQNDPDETSERKPSSPQRRIRAAGRGES